MIQRRTNRAPNAMGNMVPMLGSGYAAPSTRYCARCGCRLSRYAGIGETMCAPCAAAVHPWQPPTPRPGPALTCPECGGYKKCDSQQCRKCRERNAMTAPRQQCECGRLARRGRKRCSRCDRTRPNTGSYTAITTTPKIPQ